MNLHTASSWSAGPVTVVREGAARLVWSRAWVDQWRLTDLWPTPVQSAALESRIARGDRMLVVLDQAPQAIALHPEEVAMPLDRFDAVSDDGILVEIVVPQLEWLPEPLRTRGLIFADQAAEIIASTPAGLVPPLVLEQEDCPVRFARRSRAPLTEAALAEVARAAPRLAPRVLS